MPQAWPSGGKNLKFRTHPNVKIIVRPSRVVWVRRGRFWAKMVQCGAIQQKSQKIQNMTYLHDF